MTSIGAATRAVCMPAFGVMDFKTATNGPVWIMGTPLFYAFQVHFDLAQRQIQINQGDCTSCGPLAPAAAPAVPPVQAKPPEKPVLAGNAPATTPTLAQGPVQAAPASASAPPATTPTLAQGPVQAAPASA